MTSRACMSDVERCPGGELLRPASLRPRSGRRRSRVLDVPPASSRALTDAISAAVMTPGRHVGAGPRSAAALRTVPSLGRPRGPSQPGRPRSNRWQDRRGRRGEQSPSVASAPARIRRQPHDGGGLGPRDGLSVRPDRTPARHRQPPGLIDGGRHCPTGSPPSTRSGRERPPPRPCAASTVPVVSQPVETPAELDLPVRSRETGLTRADPVTASRIPGAATAGRRRPRGPAEQQHVEVTPGDVAVERGQVVEDADHPLLRAGRGERRPARRSRAPNWPAVRDATRSRGCRRCQYCGTVTVARRTPMNSTVMAASIRRSSSRRSVARQRYSGPLARSARRLASRAVSRSGSAPSATARSRPRRIWTAGRRRSRVVDEPVDPERPQGWPSWPPGGRQRSPRRLNALAWRRAEDPPSNGSAGTGLGRRRRRAAGRVDPAQRGHRSHRRRTPEQPGHRTGRPRPRARSAPHATRVAGVLDRARGRMCSRTGCRGRREAAGTGVMPSASGTRIR